MAAGTNGSAIVVERADRALVVRTTDADTSAVGFAAALPPEPSRTTVVVDSSAAEALHALDERLLGQLRSRLSAQAPPGWGVRLVATGAGRPDPSGAPAVAARLADRLGVGVLAPDGELIALRGGELFSAGRGAGWLGFHRDGPPEWTGPRYPAPAWQAALPRELGSAKPRGLSRFRSRERRGTAGPVTVTAIPAGLWVRAAGTAPLPLADLGFGVPVEPARPIVLVGAPGEQVPGVAELATFFETLPRVVRENALLVPYAQSPETCAALAQGIADRLDITVRAYHALPHYTTGGTRRFAIFDATGSPQRLTQTPESVYAPARAGLSPHSGERGHGPAIEDRAPSHGFAVPRPDRNDLEDDFDDLDPVVFEAALASPDEPAAWDGSASAEAAGEPAMVTVDAEGVMRPAGRWSAVTSPSARPEPFTGHLEPDVFAYEATSADLDEGFVTRADPEITQDEVAAGGPEGLGHNASADVFAAAAQTRPSAFPTTASTVLPRPRSATRAVPARSGPASPAPRPASPPPHAAGSAVPAETPGETGDRPPEEETGPTPQRPVLNASSGNGLLQTAELLAPRATEAALVPRWPDAVREGETARPSESALSLAPWPAPELVPAMPYPPAPNTEPEPGPRVHSPAEARRTAPSRASWAPPQLEPAPSLPDRPSQDEQPPAGPVARPRTPQGADGPWGVRPHAPGSEPTGRTAPSGAMPDALPVPPPRPRLDYDRLWLAGRVSTHEERQAFRGSLGWRYDAAVRSVARLLAEHPGLRGAQADEALMTELAAVRVFVARDEAGLVESIRSGGHEADRALAVCAAAGLRRLPSLQGVVVRGGPVDPSAADAYRPGQELVEAAPLVALDDVGATVPGQVEILIWSATARRLNGFVEERATPEVIFLPGTVFRVLAVDPPGAPGRRVLITEVPPTKSGPGNEAWATRVTTRLEEAAALRPAPGGEPAPDGESDGRFTPLPGDPARSAL
ncbi:hypothetical protein GCM10027176_00320 [Actinoallomurus bryophytorum]|uniref:ADP-ribosyltransferase exoenzyme n=1 Tax=Actinoallomurus bryophytorum TaxID=1490222 RepID=A0A543CH48_9ACTN|nr:hypothetical protein [Actinoallomurus bryophytorum]TQL96432.1 hypothetical protein FB559_1960 [Actinoallomurus bryophytorum]